MISAIFRLVGALALLYTDVFTANIHHMAASPLPPRDEEDDAVITNVIIRSKISPRLTFLSSSCQYPNQEPIIHIQITPIS